MSEFRFSLDSVLKVRRAERDRQRAELQDAERTQTGLRTEMDRLRQQLQQYRDHARRFLSPGSIDITELRDAHSCLLGLKQELDSLDRQWREAAERFEQCRAALIGADRRVRMLEKLCDKRRREYRRDETKRQNRHLDDLAGQSFSKVGLAPTGDFGDK